MKVAFTNGDVTIVPFDALVADDSSPGQTRYGFFEVEVPLRGNVDFVLITDSSGEKTFARVEGSEIRP